MFTIALAAIVVANCDQPPQGADIETVRGAFSNQLGGEDCVLGFSIVGNCLPTHEDITALGLSFLRPEVRNYIAVQNAFFDAANSSRKLGPNTAYAHFDNCTFEGSTNLINTNYTLAIATVMEDVAPFSCPDQSSYLTCDTPATGSTSLGAFAAVLHTAQDFYSHTNWVEQAEAQGNTGPLLDTSLGPFPVLTPYSTLSGTGLTVVDGTPPQTCRLVTADATDASLYPDSARPRLKCRKQFLPTLISGETRHDTFVTAPHDCPPIDGPGHPRNRSQTIDHNDLAKDDPAKHVLEFSAAFDLAKRQTTQEWCRFMNLIHVAPQGDARTKHVCDQWVADPASMNAACTTLPAEAQCCPAGTTRCGGQCVDPQADATNCGACGNVCNSGASCMGGACHNTCPGPYDISPYDGVSRICCTLNISGGYTWYCPFSGPR